MDISYEGEVHQVPEEAVSFLYDLTYQQAGKVKREQQLFNHVFKAIDEAEEFIVLDFFLYNDFYDSDMSFPPLSATLTKKLIDKKKEHPEMEIILITDEINTSYGSHENGQFNELERNGIKVLYTDVDALRDSNPLYSGFWRMFLQWFGQEGRGWIPNAMANRAPDMTLRSYLKLFNVKANHRKTVATDKTAIILSANPHDASADHSNIGFQIDGPIVKDLLQSEQAAANLAGGEKLHAYNMKEQTDGDLQVQLITEGKVLDKTLEMINGTKSGDDIWMGMFYLAERKVINALLDAHDRGANIRLIMDPNENAFGTQKTGLPNRPVARELNKKTNGGIQIRWYNTTEEQYHPKLLFIKKENEVQITGGSTNFTSRNLDDYNLETNVWIKAPAGTGIAKESEHYFDRLWENEDGEFTLGFEAYQNEFTPLQRVIYTVQKLLYFTTY